MQHKFIQSNFQSNNFRNCEFLPSRNCTPQFHNNIPSESSKVQLKLPQVKNSRNLSRSIVHLATKSSSPTTLFSPTSPSLNPRISAHHPPELKLRPLTQPPHLPDSAPLASRFPPTPAATVASARATNPSVLLGLTLPERATQARGREEGRGAEDIFLPALPSARLA